MNAIITGASSGIGEAIAETLAKLNINVFLLGRNIDRLKKVNNKISSYNVKAFYDVCDVTKPEDCKKSYELAKEKLETIDILITSAGVGHFNFLEELTHEQFDATFNTNVKGVFNWLKIIIPDMKMHNKGQIIIISSVSALETYKRGSLYCASKYAVQAMAEALRKEVKETRIKIATINPGSVNSPWFDGKLDADDERRKTMLTTQDVANAAKLLIEQEFTSNIDKIVLEY